ncbi:MAG TPA: Mur ligase family protein [Candidatus Nitrosotalea sp.]|nr:Mur ligase family protein [Candidatus Nitrosotalea sp.]
MSAKARLSYQEALEYLQGRGRLGVKLGLERTRELLSSLGDPQRGQRGALIAGTNGKGSTSAFLESILRARGLRTGMTPSPHLRSYTERIAVGAQPMSEVDFAAQTNRLRLVLESAPSTLGQATEFELLIAMALDWFSGRTDRLVIEVGLGGRLDSTNVLDLGVSVITNIGLDHTHLLGSTVEAIAAEKAGIIKPGNRVLTGAMGPALEVIESKAREQGAELWRLGHEIHYTARAEPGGASRIEVSGPGFSHRGLRVGLLGSFQAANAALAVAAAEALGDADAQSVRHGIESARWPGRLEIRGDLILDGGHNPAALESVVPDIAELSSGRPLGLVFAAMVDKDAPRMLDQLRRLPIRSAVFTRARDAGERGQDPECLRGLWGGGESLEPAALALQRARELAGPKAMILVCGSLYLVGELL